MENKKMKSHLAGLIQFASDDTQAATFSGTIYRKQLAKYGDWVNPQFPVLSSDPIMTLDEEWGNKIVENFNNNVLGAPVPVPLNHTNEVQANTGRVQSIESIPGDGLYGNLLITDEKTVHKLDKGEIFDVSISFDWNYIRTDNNKNYGPTLLHTALVNNPYLTEMNTFQKIGPALSKLQESFAPVGLSYSEKNTIMLSRDKMKELSDMATKTIKNEKEFAITVKFTEDGEEKELVIPAGEEATVPDDVADDVTAQIADAQDAAGDASADDDINDDDNTDADGDTKPPANETPEEELARLRLQNAELSLSREYDSLLAEGKVIPAQKEKIMALSKLSSKSIELSADGNSKVDLSTIVLDILRSGKQQFSTDESGSSKEDEAAIENKDQSNEGKKPSETLTDEELAGFKAVGADPAKMDELAEKDPVYAQALASLSKK